MPLWQLHLHQESRYARERQGVASVVKPSSQVCLLFGRCSIRNYLPPRRGCKMSRSARVGITVQPDHAVSFYLKQTVDATRTRA